MAISLFPHNEKAYQQLLATLNDSQRVTINHATGTGKSFIALKYLYENRNKRILYLTPSYPIYNQLIGPHMKDIGINYSDFRQLDNIIYPNLLKMDMKEIAADYDIIIFDEYHRCGAKEWNKKIKELFQIIGERYPEKKLIGLTATPTRYLDKERNMNDELFGGTCASELLLSDAIIDGLLPAPKYVNIPVNSVEEIARVRNLINRRVEYKEDRDAYIERLAKIEKKITEETDLLNESQVNLDKDEGKFVVFCSKIDDIAKNQEFIRKQFKDKDLHFYEVHSRQTKIKNEKELDEFRNVKSGYNFIFVVDILNEGVHVKDVDGVFMLRKTTSPIIYFQQLGRLLSFSARNKNLVLWDLVDNLKNHQVIYQLYNEVLTRAKELITKDPEHKERYEKILENFKIIDKSTELLSDLGILDKELSTENQIEVKKQRIIKILTTKDYPDVYQALKAKRDLESMYVYLTKEDFVMLRNYNVPLPSQIDVSLEKFESMLGGYKTLFELNTVIAEGLINRLQEFVEINNRLPNLYSDNEEESILAFNIKKHYHGFNNNAKARIKKILRNFDDQDIIEGLFDKDVSKNEVIDNNLLSSLILERKINPFNYIKLTDYKKQIEKVKRTVKRRVEYDFEQQVYLDELADIKKNANLENNIFDLINKESNNKTNVMLVSDLKDESLIHLVSNYDKVVCISSDMKLSEVQNILNTRKEPLLYIIDDIDLIPLISDSIDNMFVLKNQKSNEWLDKITELSEYNLGILNLNVLDIYEDKTSFNGFKSVINEIRDNNLGGNTEIKQALVNSEYLNRYTYEDLSYETEMALDRLTTIVSKPTTNKSKLDTALYVLKSNNNYNAMDIALAKRTIYRLAKYLTIEQFRQIDNKAEILPPFLQVNDQEFISLLDGYSCIQEREEDVTRLLINEVENFMMSKNRVPTILSPDKTEVRLALDFIALPSIKAKKEILEKMPLLPRFTIFEQALYGFTLDDRQKIILIKKLESSSDRFLLHPIVQKIIKKIINNSDEEVEQIGRNLFQRFNMLLEKNRIEGISYEEAEEAFERLMSIIKKYKRFSKADYETSRILTKYGASFQRFGFSKQIDDLVKEVSSNRVNKELEEIMDFVNSHDLLGLPSETSTDKEEVKIAKAIKRLWNSFPKEVQDVLSAREITNNDLDRLADLYYEFVLKNHRRPLLLTVDEDEYNLSFNYQRLSKKMNPQLTKRNAEAIRKITNIMEEEYNAKVSAISNSISIITNYMLNNLLVLKALDSDNSNDNVILSIKKRFAGLYKKEQLSLINEVEYKVKDIVVNKMIEFLKANKAIPSIDSDDLSEKELVNKYNMVYPFMSDDDIRNVEDLEKQIFKDKLVEFVNTHDGDYPSIDSSINTEVQLANLMSKYFHQLSNQERHMIDTIRMTKSLETESVFWNMYFAFVINNKCLPDINSPVLEERELAIRFKRKEPYMSFEQRRTWKDIIEENNVDTGLHKN